MRFQHSEIEFKVDLGWVYLVLYCTAHNNIWVQVFMLPSIRLDFPKFVGSISVAV